jgi:hypothetical protein
MYTTQADLNQSPIVDDTVIRCAVTSSRGILDRLVRPRTCPPLGRVVGIICTVAASNASYYHPRVDLRVLGNTRWLTPERAQLLWQDSTSSCSNTPSGAVVSCRKS